MSASDWIALVALAVSIVVAFLSWKHNKDTREETEKATAAATASASAAERSADAAGEANKQFGRMAAAMEVMARQNEKVTAEVAHQTGSPAWSMTHIKGMVFEIENTGSGDAYDVDLASENAIRFDARTEVPSPWSPGQAVQFLAAGSMQTGTPVIALSWRDAPNGERNEWTRPVPPRT